MSRPRKKSAPNADTGSALELLPHELENQEDKMPDLELGQLPIGARLVVRSKKDWRNAAVSRIVEGTVVLTICSPSGHCYRLRRTVNEGVMLEGGIHVLAGSHDDHWKDNFSSYDQRW